MRNKLLFWHKFKKMMTYAATINKGPISIYNISIIILLLEWHY